MVKLVHTRPLNTTSVKLKRSLKAKVNPPPAANNLPLDGVTPLVEGSSYQFSDTMLLSMMNGTATASDYSKLKSFILTLPDKNKKIIKDALALDAKSKATEPSRDLEILEAAVSSELKKVVGGSDVRILKGTTAYQSLVKSLPLIVSFCLSSDIPCSTSYEKIKCFNVIASLLVLYAKGISSRIKTPLTPQLVLKQVGNLPGIFDSAYPGYVNAGIAHIIFK